MRTRLLLAALALLLPVSVSAQVQPIMQWPGGVTPPIFGLPHVNGSNITPASVGVPASTCAAPGIYLTTATTTGIAFTATPSVILCVNGTAILTSTGSAVTSGVPILIPDGAVGAPGLASATLPTSGLYWTNAGTILRLALSGVNNHLWTSVGYFIRSDSAAITFGASDDAIITRLAADIIAPASGDAWGLASKAWIRTAPSNPVACTSPAVTWSNGSASFQVDVGTSCAGISTLVVTLPAVTNAYSCTATNATTSATAAVEMTASTTTTATFTNYTRTTGVALAWADGADVRVSCTGG